MIQRATLLLLSFLAISFQLEAQHYSGTYRSEDNPHYWKNRKPHEAYWQQDVSYTIKARIDDQSDILDCTLRLVYYNNSPDILPYVYFHLYQNAFLPNSHYDNLQKDNGTLLRFGHYQKMGLGTVVEEILVGGRAHGFSVDNTILRVDLAEPIKSKDSAVFDIRFKTYFNHDAGWGRMRLYHRWGFKHFNGAHFYPRISVYDSRFGWTADQHLVHEFYGNFGSYEVALDFPENYILEGTGLLENEAEVLPADLRAKLDISNFRDKPFNSTPDIIIPYDSSRRKIWRYHAVNVHDFAFVASPTYRLAEVMYNGVKCVAIAHEPHASRWQTAAQLTADIIAFFNARVGEYAYPKMVVADAFSGMEYPMLTMNSGTDPDYAYIFSHEIGHNWFFGMVGSNETSAALLDEGFTQYLTVIALDSLAITRPVASEMPALYHRRFAYKPDFREVYAYLRYHRHAVNTEGVRLNTHSDMFDTKRPYGEEYRQTYYKGGVMLFNLEYVLGEELFAKALKDYFEKWKFCHPYIEDMRASFIHSTNVDLNWFFDQFIETPKVIDYAVGRVRKNRSRGTHTINFRRKGEMQMPIDFTVVGKNDSLYYFHIPNTNFIKTTNAVVLPKWYGWMHFNKDYVAEISIPSGIKNVIIDPTHTLADVYAPDNRLRKQIRFSFDYLINNTEDRRFYGLYYRPDLWWNAKDGLKAGVNINGHYMKHHHDFDLSLFYNTGVLREPSFMAPCPFSYILTYRTPVSRYARHRFLDFKSMYSEGFLRQNLQFDYLIPKTGSKVFMGIKSMFRNHTGIADSYLIHPKEWSDPNANINGHFFNNIFFLGWQNIYNNPLRYGQSDLLMRSSVFSNYDFSTLTFTQVNNERMDLLTLRTRLFAQWAYGSNIPVESMLYLAGANGEEMSENPFTRASGIFPQSLGGYGLNTSHFHYGGGLNIRGYAGYVAAYTASNGQVIATYRGHSGASVNTELEFDKLLKIKPPYISNFLKMHTYIFADAGFISANNISDRLELSHLRASAGAGFALTIRNFGPFTKLKPLTLRCDIPFFLNRPPAIDNDFVKLRWIVGLKRAF